MEMHSLEVAEGWYKVTALLTTEADRQAASRMCHELSKQDWRSQLLAMENNLQHDYGHLWGVSFENPLHAVLFKLRWGICE